MSVPAKRDDTESEPVLLSEELQARFAQMATVVPDETDSGYENILAQIFEARTAEELSEPWESTGAVKLAGKALRIDGISRRESDYDSGLRLFLVVRYVDLDSGERGVFTTSSVAMVGQLVQAYCAGWLPLYAEIVVSDRATKKGYRPHHLRVTASPKIG